MTIPSTGLAQLPEDILLYFMICLEVASLMRLRQVSQLSLMVIDMSHICSSSWADMQVDILVLKSKATLGEPVSPREYYQKSAFCALLETYRRPRRHPARAASIAYLEARMEDDYAPSPSDCPILSETLCYLGTPHSFPVAPGRVLRRHLEYHRSLVGIRPFNPFQEHCHPYSTS